MGPKSAPVAIGKRTRGGHGKIDAFVTHKRHSAALPVAGFPIGSPNRPLKSSAMTPYRKQKS